MKSKIAIRLTAYFGAALLLFSLLTGCVFAWMFGRYSTDVHRQELETRATRIAATMAGFMDNASGGDAGGHGSGGARGGYGAYLKFLDDIAMTDIWLVDRDAGLVSRGFGSPSLSYKELPNNAEQVIRQVYGGGVAFSESFSELLGQNTLTVGAPVLSKTGTVLGAVLLHSPIDGQKEARAHQVSILLASILLALFLTVPIAVVLSLRFTKPLSLMKQHALVLAEKNYFAKNHIRQRDEIGDLAEHMDLLADRLAEAEQERQEQEQTRRAFLSSISHELRTPVTVMRGSLEALCDGVVTEPGQVEEYHRQMLHESIHMQRLVNDLLELSRLQSAGFQMEMDIVDLWEVAEDVARTMGRIAESKDITVSTRDLEHIPVHGDYNRLRQMLMTVVDNGIKFSEQGQDVSISGQQRQGRYCLCVQDTGKGISPEELPHIFDRFHKENSDGNRQGAGLGLAIAREIAQRHQVEIQVESRPGSTRFYFLFPSDGKHT